jgi:hypothetical protein
MLRLLFIGGYYLLLLLLLLFILTANGVLPGGSGNTIRHNKQICKYVCIRGGP